MHPGSDSAKKHQQTITMTGWPAVAIGGAEGHYVSLAKAAVFPIDFIVQAYPDKGSYG